MNVFKMSSKIKVKGLRFAETGWGLVFYFDYFCSDSWEHQANTHLSIWCKSRRLLAFIARVTTDSKTAAEKDYSGLPDY